MKVELGKVAKLVGLAESEAEELRGTVFGKKDPQELESAVRAYCQWLREGGAAVQSIEVEMRKEQLAKLKAERRISEAKASGSGTTLVDCAGLLGVKTDTLKKWHSQGCPGEKSGSGVWRFEVAEVFAWRVERERELVGPSREEIEADGERLDPEQEMARKNKELADKAALENAVSRRELIHQDDVAELEKSWGEHIMAAKAKLLGIGGALAPTLAGEQEPAKVKEEVDSAVRQALRELTTDD